MKFTRNTNRVATRCARPRCGWPLALTLGLSLLLPAAAQAQRPAAPRPGTPAPMSVLLFPASMSVGEGAAPAADAGATTAQQVPEMVTEALRKYLARNGVSVVQYDRRLPSIERAVAEGSLRLDDVAGPGDDPRQAQRLAEFAGASEYVTAIVDAYRYEPATRTASLNLTLSRNATSDGLALGTAASPGTGVAPEDVVRPRQEGSAAARAAEAASEQTVQRLFPAPPAPAATTRTDTARSSIGRKDAVVFGILGGLVGLLILAD